MVKIPKFWYRRYRSGNVEYLKIAGKATGGFTLHPAFNHGGVAKDHLYVGAYKTSENIKSVSGVEPLGLRDRAAVRSAAKAKGTGWGIIDIAALSAIQMLILVEFANNNVQYVIGRGFCDGNYNTPKRKTGTCDEVSGLTGRPAGTDGMVDVVWRGIEGLWGNVWEWVDGINWNNGTYYVCNDPSKYADNTTTNYTALSFKGATNWSSSYITQEGLTLAVILMSCSRLPQVAVAKRPTIVTLVGLLLVGAAYNTAVITTVARIVVSLRLVWTLTHPCTRTLGRACFISPPKGVRQSRHIMKTKYYDTVKIRKLKEVVRNESTRKWFSGSCNG